jgi:hypothetical protein
MQTNTDFSQSNDLSVLLIGPPLTGKTNLAMCFPRPWFASTDRKLGNAVSRHPGKEFYYDYFDHLDPDKRFVALVEATLKAIADPKVETIVHDNLTDIQDYIIGHILGIDAPKLTVGGEKSMEKQHWGPFASLLKRLISKTKQSKKYYILICHERIVESALDGMLLYQPMLGGAMKDLLPGLFTNVWRTETEVSGTDVQYYVRTVPSNRSSYLGNSLGLPANFKFTWEEFAKKLNPTTKPVEPKPKQIDVPVAQ